MDRRIRLSDVACALALSMALTACSDSGSGDPVNPYAGFSSPRYADAAMWLCRPDLATDQCRSHDLSGTASLADGSLREVPAPAPVSTSSEVDCFYVYPTVDLSGTPGNHTDFDDLRPMLDPLLVQGAPFQGMCRVFAPLYRQGTIASFASPDAETIFALAYADVEDAFRHYMGQFNQGRKVVVIGHSQGTDMTTRLVRNEFDASTGLRERLITALLIGGQVTVPEGQLVGGSFEHVPLCHRAEETGCVIAFRTYAAGYPPTAGSNAVSPDGLDTACTNPAAPGGGPARLRAAYFPTSTFQPIFFVRDPSASVPAVDGGFLVYPDFYTAECVKDDQGRSYLEIGRAGDPGDSRPDPILYTHPTLAPSFLGTHVLDFSYTLGDLLELVRVKIAAAR